MGLDYGTKTVGVAISDALGLTAQGIETIQRKEENKLRRTLARIEELVREYEVDTIVLGFPKHMNNDVGERAKKSLEFKEMLVRRTGLDVVMWDERLTTVEAERTLIESQVRRENRKQYIDKIAAVFILQGYLDYLSHQKESQENGTKEYCMEKITFVTDDGGKEEFYVEEQTRINGVNYILVSDSKDDEANAYILKDISTDTDAEAEYVMVEDDTEFDAVSGVFASMLDDEADITY